MKKIYKKPLAKIIELETECLIANSPTYDPSDSTNREDDFAVGSYRKKLWED